MTKCKKCGKKISLLNAYEDNEGEDYCEKCWGKKQAKSSKLESKKPKLTKKITPNEARTISIATKILAILFFLEAIVRLLLIGPASSQASNIGLIFGLSSLLLLYISWGLWNRKNSARILAIIISFLGVVFSLVYSGELFSSSIGFIYSIAINLFAILILNNRKTRLFFKQND